MPLLSHLTNQFTSGYHCCLFIVVTWRENGFEPSRELFLKNKRLLFNISRFKDDDSQVSQTRNFLFVSTKKERRRQRKKEAKKERKKERMKETKKERKCVWVKERRRKKEIMLLGQVLWLSWWWGHFQHQMSAVRSSHLQNLYWTLLLSTVLKRRK